MNTSPLVSLHSQFGSEKRVKRLRSLHKSPTSNLWLILLPHFGLPIFASVSAATSAMLPGPTSPGPKTPNHCAGCAAKRARRYGATETRGKIATCTSTSNRKAQKRTWNESEKDAGSCLASGDTAPGDEPFKTQHDLTLSDALGSGRAIPRVRHYIDS